MWSVISRILDNIHQEIAGVRTEVVELRSAKQHLEQLQAEGLFAFSRKVEPLAFFVKQ